MHILLILWANPHAIVYLFHVILYAEPRTNAFPDVGFTNPISCQAQEGWVNTTIYGLGKKKQDI